MTSRFRLISFSSFRTIVLALVLFCSYVYVSPVQAKPSSLVIQDFQKFAASVVNGSGAELRGVYVPNVMALPVIQQPNGYPGFVPQNQDQLAQFGMAAEAGNVGLLAHNYLSGYLFPLLAQGDNVTLVYGDGRTESFVVTHILKYQALDPNSPTSDFMDLETQSVMSAEQLFSKAYRGERHVTFQTCIEADGNLSWGRLFVIAEPITNIIIPATYADTGYIYEWIWNIR